MNNTKQSGQHLTWLFIQHAAGMSVRRMFCHRCQRETQHGKTAQDSFYYCLECLPKPEEAQDKNLTK